jgi:hypothetical protein
MPLVLNGTTGVQDNSGAFVAGTAIATTSGTSIDFTGIPSWVKRITVMFDGVSTSGSALKLLQIGDNGGISDTGYNGGAAYGGSTNQYSVGNQSIPLSVFNNSTAAETMFGSIILTNLQNNTWVAQGCFYMATFTVGNFVAGSKSLANKLDRIRITTNNGTDTFDAGSINILYE